MSRHFCNNPEIAIDIQKFVDNYFAETPNVTTEVTHHHYTATGEYSSSWVNIYFDGRLLFTVSSIEQFQDISAAFAALHLQMFTAPSEETMNDMEKAYLVGYEQGANDQLNDIHK
jgi:hypothetical protein